MHYYNENNPEAAAMLRQMIANGLLSPADVDERPIQEVKPDDLKKYTQCHFFAGIGGWQYALQLAEWPATKPVWTGSCPCQPFSAAGLQKGKTDERHLWPEWLRLIRQCKPATIFGEQVSTAITHGWLDDVYEGLEGEGYAIGAAVLPACSVGAPHKRDRLWFVAHAKKCSSGAGLCNTEQEEQRRIKPCHSGSAMGYPQQQGLERHAGHEQNGDQPGRDNPHQGRPTWATGVWTECPDGKQRLVEPSIPLLADGVQHRRPILHALGNAIVPQVAAEFIKATM